MLIIFSESASYLQVNLNCAKKIKVFNKCV